MPATNHLRQTANSLCPFLALTILYVACSQPVNTGSRLACEKNKSVVAKVMNAFQTGDTVLLKQHVADNYIEHSPDPQIKSRGLQGLLETSRLYHSTFPNQKKDFEYLICEGDMVVGFFTVNDFARDARPSSNKPGELNEVHIFRLKKEKVIEHWVCD